MNFSTDTPHSTGSHPEGVEPSKIKSNLVSAGYAIGGLALGWLGAKGYELLSGHDIRTGEEIATAVVASASLSIIDVMHVLKSND